MGLKLELKSGSFSGHVFPVDLDVAYDPVSEAAQSVEAVVYLFYDEGVLQLDTKSISPAGIHTPGTGVITWSEQTIVPGAGWKKYSASFQWIDFRVGQTAFNGAANAGNSGLQSAPVLFVSRPASVSGLKMREKD